MGDYLRPRTLAAALAALAERPLVVLAGGTDHFPARAARPTDEDILDIGAVEGLRAIEDKGDRWRIGALATWADLIAADLPPLFDGLKSAARDIGGPQVQNAATVLGNLCNASPAADGAPPLLTLDAGVELANKVGAMVLPLGRFLKGNRATARTSDQLATAILIPKPKGAAVGGFLKLGARSSLVISIVSVAATLETDGAGKVRAARIAVGSCAPTALRLPALEGALAGKTCGKDLSAVVEAAHLAPLSPIDDVRATAAYRKDAALTLLKRLLAELGEKSAGRR